MKASKLYGRLLSLYPASFREKYESALEQQFQDEYRELPNSWARAGFWLKAVTDVAVSIPPELFRELRQDARYAARVYRNRAAVTTLALSALALAIGASTGIFSVVNAVLLRSLPFRDPQRLVHVDTAISPKRLSLRGKGFDEFRRSTAYIDDAAIYRPEEMNVSTGGEAIRAAVTETTANFFDLLGTVPVSGRWFAPEESMEGRDQVAVIAYGVWQRFFGGDPRVLGATIRVQGVPMTVIGVAPPSFDFPAKTSVWTPTLLDVRLLPINVKPLGTIIGRLKTGLTLAQSRQIYYAEVQQQIPALWKDPARRPNLVPIREQLAGPVRESSLVLLGLVTLVLLIASANVAQLLLSRVIERRSELAIRAALGASRARIVQQLITESVLLTSCAAIAGLAVARWSVRLVSVALPAKLSAQEYTILDGRVLGFAMGIALLTGLLFGTLPAWLLGAQSQGNGTGVRRVRSGLIAVQAALALVLVSGCLTLGRSFLKLTGTDLGFHTANIATFTVSPFISRDPTDHQLDLYYHEVLGRLERIPGVESVGGVDYLPLAGLKLFGSSFTLDSGQDAMAVEVAATPGYFRTMGIEMVAGRDFNANDLPSTAAIVNEDFARQTGLGAAIVGRRVILNPNKPSEQSTVVGLVRTTHFNPLRLDYTFDSQIYEPAVSPLFLTFVARTTGGPAAYLAAGRDTIRTVNRDVPVYDVETLDQRLEQSLARPRFFTTVVLFFGILALLLAVIGTYGVASYSVAQRTHEIGVRLAVGGTTADVRGMLARQGMLPVLAGITAGLAGAASSGSVLQHLIASAQSPGIAICSAAACGLAVTALLAVWKATARVTHLDPMSILRAD